MLYLFYNLSAVNVHVLFTQIFPFPLGKIKIDWNSTVKNFINGKYYFMDTYRSLSTYNSATKHIQQCHTAVW